MVIKNSDKSLYKLCTIFKFYYLQALEKYCRVPGGYTGIKNVYQENPVKDDVQQSFFLAETLKVWFLDFFL